LPNIKLFKSDLVVVETVTESGAQAQPANFKYNALAILEHIFRRQSAGTSFAHT
jgi:hypothetical protein